jgi:hypothetical protein
LQEQWGDTAMTRKCLRVSTARQQEPELRQLCRNLVTMTPFEEVPIGVPKPKPQGNAMVSVRITATGAVVFASLSFLTAPVSACDERYIKKCERASAAAAGAAAETADSTPAAKRKAAGRVQTVVSRHSKHIRFAKRTRAPAFTMKRERGMTLASAEVRAAMPASESALTRRFRGFINPQPIAQNAFEVWRKPHIVAVDLEPPMSAPQAAAEEVAEAPAPVADPAVATAKQDRAAPKPAQMELASAESKPVTLPELPAVQTKPAMLATANSVPAPAVPPAYVSEAPQPAPADSPASRFSIHQLVLALCGALGAASALRFIVGA